MQTEGQNDQKRLHLQAEVAQLQQVFENEHRLNTFLHRVLEEPFVCYSGLSSSVSSQAYVLFGEIAKVEEEILDLEGKLEELKLTLYGERKNRKEYQAQWEQKQQRHKFWDLEGHGVIKQSQSSNKETHKHHPISNKKTSDDEVKNTKTFEKTDRTGSLRSLRDKETFRVSSNKISEQLVKVLVSIFQKLIVPPARLKYEETTTSMLNISCMRSKSFMTKHLTGSSMLPDCEIGPYKKCMQLTRSTIDMNRIAFCRPAIEKLRVLIRKVAVAEVHFLSYKQRLAFWINIYNASIMDAFLQHGLPTSPGKLLELLNRAAFNVGGIVLNSLAIEHFILRHSSDNRYGMLDEKEVLLQRTYGRDYPEPNITFALCRGSWSSPALRIYTEENVSNELERAKMEFLEASIRVTSSRKISMPKLLHWHMLDFADDVESLMKWICSQLPTSSLLKRAIMEILSAAGRSAIPASNMVEIRPYDAEFCYFVSNCEC